GAVDRPLVLLGLGANGVLQPLEVLEDGPRRVGEELGPGAQVVAGGGRAGGQRLTDGGIAAEGSDIERMQKTVVRPEVEDSTPLAVRVEEGPRRWEEHTSE